MVHSIAREQSGHVQLTGLLFFITPKDSKSGYT